MFDSNTRCVYLAELQPPPGFALDRAIATTFSLDLLALLLAPVSMFFSDPQDWEEPLQNPVVLLESLKQAAGCFAVFCQEGRISVPRADTLLYSYLERAVVEVQPSGSGVFHPKVWVLRFVREDDGKQVIFYRFLCLSRNLTFDQSWDTALVLEGRLADRKNAYSRNWPIHHFLRSLPELAVREFSPEVQEHIDIISDEILRVKFEPPDGFADKLRFLPVGIEGYRRLPELDHHTRLLMISPFLSDEALKPLVERGKNNILISRPESLDALNEETYRSLKNSDTSIYIMDNAAEKPETEFETWEQEEEVETVEDDLSGLHAKLYILEEGWEARMWTGSANATNAAFSGANMEFLVELQGKRSKVGIDTFLGDDEEQDAFSSMLSPYRRSDHLEELDLVGQQLEKVLNEGRTAVTKAELFLETYPTGDNTWSLRLNAAQELLLGGVTGVCCPVTLNKNVQSLEPLLTCEAVIFPDISTVSLTSFIVFKLTAYSGDRNAGLNFVLNLPIHGLPDYRDKAILQNIISSKERFFQYLFLLLAGGNDDTSSAAMINYLVGSKGDHTRFSGDIPLLEELVRACSRAPERIDRIAQLVNDLKDTDGGSRQVPPEFEKIWGAFLALRRGGVAD